MICLCWSHPLLAAQQTCTLIVFFLFEPQRPRHELGQLLWDSQRRSVTSLVLQIRPLQAAAVAHVGSNLPDPQEGWGVTPSWVVWNMAKDTMSSS